jgi:hypothetical protein
MNKLTTLITAGAVALALIGPAAAAWYAKFDGVDGSVKSAEWRGGALYLTTDEDPEAIGLLLPAIQGSHEAARRSTPARARKVAEFELSNGAKSWTLYDAQILPTSNRKEVEVRYRCMDWADSRTGKLGSDCPGGLAAGKDGAKGGNVEFEWKVEEGES